MVRVYVINEIVFFLDVNLCFEATECGESIIFKDMKNAHFVLPYRDLLGEAFNGASYENDTDKYKDQKVKKKLCFQIFNVVLNFDEKVESCKYLASRSVTNYSLPSDHPQPKHSCVNDNVAFCITKIRIFLLIFAVVIILLTLSFMFRLYLKSILEKTLFFKFSDSDRLMAYADQVSTERPSTDH